MEAYTGTILSILGSIVAIAVAWGWYTARADEQMRWRQDVEKRLEQIMANMVSKDHCLLKHVYLEQTVTEIKTDLRAIKEMLQELSRDRNK